MQRLEGRQRKADFDPDADEFVVVPGVSAVDGLLHAFVLPLGQVDALPALFTALQAPRLGQDVHAGVSRGLPEELQAVPVRLRFAGLWGSRVGWGR